MQNIMTVTGTINPDELGFTSTHEHVFLDNTRQQWSANTVLNNVDLAYKELMMYKEAGGVSIIDVTTADLMDRENGRLLPVKHPEAVKDMAERTGLNIILGTGWYREPYYHKRLNSTTVNQIADELVEDIETGIDGTNVKAGVLGEIGTHFSWISPVEERVFRAVARAHKKTGVLITTHTNWSPVGIDHLNLLEEEGVDLRRVIVGHVQFWPDNDYHLELIRRGAFVAFDRMGTTNKTEFGIFVNAIKNIISAGFAENIVLGQDICYRADYVSYGGNGYRYMPYKMKEDFLANGISEEAYNLMVFENPRRALTGEN